MWPELLHQNPLGSLLERDFWAPFQETQYSAFSASSLRNSDATGHWWFQYVAASKNHSNLTSPDGFMHLGGRMYMNSTVLPGLGPQLHLALPDSLHTILQTCTGSLRLDNLHNPHPNQEKLVLSLFYKSGKGKFLPKAIGQRVSQGTGSQVAHRLTCVDYKLLWTE